MDPAQGAGGGSKTVAPGAPAHLRWDIADMDTHTCSLATATTTPSEIILNFGERRRRGDRSGEVHAELMRRIALSPLTAKNLAATLQRLIDEHDAGSR